MNKTALKSVLLLLFVLAQLPVSSQYDNSTLLTTSTFTGNTIYSSLIDPLCIGDGKIPDWRTTFTYFIWCPTWAIIGILGNGICLLAAWRQAKKDHFYILQGFIMLFDFFSCVTSLPYSTLVAEVMMTNLGPNLAKQSLFLSWYIAHVGIVLPNIFSTTSILLTFLTVIDRMQAIILVVKYGNWNHKKRAATIGVTCFVIGILTSLHDTTRYTIEYCPETQHYQLYMTIPSNAAVVAEIIRIVIRAASVLGTIILAPILGFLYHRKQKQGAAIAASATRSKENVAVTSNTLAKLLFLQVVSIVFAATPLLVWYFIACFLPVGSLSAESSLKLLYVADILFITMSGTNFVFFCGTSKSFRRTLRDVVIRKTTVAPVFNAAVVSNSER